MNYLVQGLLTLDSVMQLTKDARKKSAIWRKKFTVFYAHENFHAQKLGKNGYVVIKLMQQLCHTPNAFYVV